MILVNFIRILLVSVVFLSTTGFKLPYCVLKSERNTIHFANKNLLRTNYAMSASDMSEGDLIEVDDYQTENLNITALMLPRLSWNAAVISSVRVKERGRTCEEYMRLPASECKCLNNSISLPHIVSRY